MKYPFLTEEFLREIYSYSHASSYYTLSNLEEFTKKVDYLKISIINDDLKTQIMCHERARGGGVVEGLVIYEIPP